MKHLDQLAAPTGRVNLLRPVLERYGLGQYFDAFGVDPGLDDRLHSPP